MLTDYIIDPRDIDAEDSEGAAIIDALGADWDHVLENCETLISEDYFEDYARELAEDIGAIDPDAGWPNTYIDWERAAKALQMDYSSVDVERNGATYSFFFRA